MLLEKEISAGDWLPGIVCLVTAGAIAWWLAKRSRRCGFRGLSAGLMGLVFACGVGMLMIALPREHSTIAIPSQLRLAFTLGSFAVMYGLALLAPYLLALTGIARLAEARRCELLAQSAAIASLKSSNGMPPAYLYQPTSCSQSVANFE